MRWRERGLVLVLMFASTGAVAAGIRIDALQDRVNHWVDVGYEAPQRALAGLAAEPGRSPTERRVIAAGTGLVAADSNLAPLARAAIAELESLVGAVGPIAHADALLVESDLAMSSAAESEVAHKLVQTVVAYSSPCDGAGLTDPARCNFLDAFYANMFAGVELSGNPSRAAASMYLVAARDIAARTHRPDLEARAMAFMSELAQSEGDRALADASIARALLLAERSKDASALEFVRLFMSSLQQDRGNLAQAMQELQASQAIARAVGHARRVVECASRIAELELQEKRPAQALQGVDDAMAFVDRNHLDFLRIPLATTRVVALLQLRRLDEGRHELASLLDRIDAAYLPGDRSDAINEIGDAMFAAGDADGAMALFAREQKVLLAGGDKHFQRAVLQRQADLRAGQQAARGEEIRHWAQAAGAALALLLGAMGVAAWMRMRNRRLASANAALRDQAERDPLTRLSNREGFLRRLRERGWLHEFAGMLLMLDVDHFKRINDTLGHAGGDVVLQEVAARLQACVRDGDLVARWGGEEFVVAVPGTPGDADVLAGRIMRSLAGAPVNFQDRSVRVTASIGVVALPLASPGRPLSFDETLAVADAGMYYAKRHGRHAAVRILGLPAVLLDDLGGLPDAVEREARTGAVRLAVSRIATLPDPGGVAPAEAATAPAC